MPLFVDKFTLKSQKRLVRNPDALAPGVRHLSTEARRLEFGIAFHQDVSLNLGPHILFFNSETQQWQLKSTIDASQDSPSVNSKKNDTNDLIDVTTIEKQVTQLQDENRLLKLKIEILMNLLSDVPMPTDKDLE